MIEPIVIYGDDYLTSVSDELVESEDKAKEISDALHDTLATTTGCGLACRQIGLPYRAFLVKYKDFDKVFFDPVIEEYSEEKNVEDEGCLSVPGIFESVERSLSVVISYRDEHLKSHREQINGFPARIIQHELDHLNGIMFVDKISKVRRHMIRKDLEKLEKGKYTVKYKTKRDA